MPECVLLKHCEFFREKMAEMPYSAMKVRLRFCESGGEGCARLIAFEKLGGIPSDLLPQQLEELFAMVDEAVAGRKLCPELNRQSREM